MKSATRKYVRLLDAQSKVYTKLSKLSCSGDNWRKEREQTEKLEAKNQEYQVKLDTLEPSITEEEFEEHLSDRMCLRWEEFNQI
tara:strand:+ start:2774 stop:3025 length:252 start_codon:yes stop_codon:yes gene_type:complete